MAEPRKPAAAERRESAPLVAAGSEKKKYKIVHAIVLGKGEAREIRNSGFVTAAEVGGERVIEELLKAGTVGDPDAPVRPSEASEHRARAFAIDVAIRGGVMTAEGERYTFEGETYAGAEALARIPLVELGDAIVERLKAKAA